MVYGQTVLGQRNGWHSYVQRAGSAHRSLKCCAARYSPVFSAAMQHNKPALFRARESYGWSGWKCCDGKHYACGQTPRMAYGNWLLQKKRYDPTHPNIALATR